MKNNRINSGIILTTFSFMLVLAMGCAKSFLDVPPQGKEKGAIFWQKASDADEAVNAMYANLREWNNVAFAALAVESMGSDEAEKGSTASDATFFNQYDNFTVTSTEGQLGGFWKAQYQEINLCNQVITNVDTMSTVAADLKTRYIAEAKFLRAYSYFRLVRAFGGVPLRLSLPADASEYNLAKADTADIWNAIEKDLTDAASVLPATYSSADVGRATKGAALSLHAKVCMYRAKWADVFNYTNLVISSSVYSLFPDYEKLFRVENENCSESVFEIQSSLIQGNKEASNSQFSQVQGVRGVTGGGWGFNVPTTALADAYETGDPRRDATIIFRGETTPQGDVIPAVGDNPMYNQKSYVPFSMYVNGYNEGCQQNIRVLRYADVLLMHAEAANELGNTSQALASLELVRARARKGNASILPAVTTTDKAMLRNAIWNERKVELAMESDRYFDVIRQGRAAEVFGPKGWKAGKNEVWPIPQTEIDNSAGTLIQNKGY
ncbi:MAG: RagB/SusD family nutrient uptake outer membrane protein [Niabella sp.]